MLKFNEISLLYFIEMIKKVVLCDFNAINQVSVERSHPRILSTDSKDKTSLQDSIIPLL